MRRRAATTWLIALAVGGCGGSATPTASGGEDETGGETDAEPPAILQGGDQIQITADEVEPLELPVDRVVLGQTQLFVDGRSVVLAGTESDEISLDERTLVIELRGGMAVGEHRLQLVTPGEPETLRSRELELRIEPAPPRSIEVTLGDEAVANGSAMWVEGDGNRTLLSVLQLSGDLPTLTLFRGGGSIFLAESATFELPELSVTGASRPPVSAGLLVGDEGNELRLAWVRGVDRRELVVRAEDWDSPGMSAPTSVIVPTDLPEAAEWAQLGTPAFMGDALVVELLAPLDTEQSRPGDHGLLAVRWTGTPPSPEAPTRIVLDRPLDLDQLGPGVDLRRTADGRRSLGVRYDGARPWTLLSPRAGEAGAARIRLGDGDPERAPFGFEGELLGLASVVGSFGGRSALGVRADGKLREAVFGEFDPQASARNPTGALPESGPTGPPAASTIGGVPVFLVPHGAAEPVTVLTGDGERLRAAPIADLFCDQVALMVSEPANRNGAAGLACLRAGQVRFGTLRVEEPD